MDHRHYSSTHIKKAHTHLHPRGMPNDFYSEKRVVGQMGWSAGIGEQIPSFPTKWVNLFTQ